MVLRRRETTVAITIAKNALALAEQGTGSVRFKIGRDVVTDADEAVEDLVRSELEHTFGLVVIGEERGGEQPPDDSYWLLDPICGTRNFASRIPLFSTNIALVENGQLTVAVVADGSTGAVYAAELRSGAWEIDATGSKQLRVDGASRIVNIDGWPDAGLEREHAARVLASAIRADDFDVRSLSTTLGLAYVASGRIASQILFSTPALHAGAGALLAKEAGGIVSQLDGSDWHIDSTSLIASADPELHATLLAMCHQT
jgi:myo-inositol-1(or 4)-monophosphatase